MARYTSHFISLILEDPLTQERIAHTIHLGMCQFLHDSPEKIANLSPVLARKHGEDFPKIMSNFFAGLLQSSAIAKKQPQPQSPSPTSKDDKQRSSSFCPTTCTTTPMEQSSAETAASLTPSKAWISQQQQSQTWRKTISDDDAASMDIPELLLATPEQPDYYATTTARSTSTTTTTTPKTRSSSSLRTLKSFPSFQRKSCPPEPSLLDHSYHNDNSTTTTTSTMDPKKTRLLQMRMLEMEEYFDAIDIAQCILSETSTIVHDPS
jgi:hypothetical protein